jgi:radical SAM protein with 4Fe4S-binding SPASM domain
MQIFNYIRKIPKVFRILTPEEGIRSRLTILKKLFITKKYRLPTVVAIEPISACNLDCDFCMIRELKTYKYRRKTKMTFDEFKKIVDDISYFCTDIQYSGGEPLTNDDIFDMIKYARHNQIRTCLATNGILLNENNVKKLLDAMPTEVLLSYEALDKDTYEGMRKRGEYEKLEANIKRLIARKKERGQKYPKITLQMVLTKKNVKDENEFWKAAESLGADAAAIKPLGIWPEGSEAYDRKMIDEYLLPDHKISRHKLDDDDNLLPMRKVGRCASERTPMIGSGGEVLPCWYILINGWEAGNVSDKSFMDIWNSDEYVAYRNKMRTDWAMPYCEKCIGTLGGREKRIYT